MSFVDRVQALRSKLLTELESLLSSEEAKRARSDPHARRSPRPCGITVHPGIGCVYKCRYCYVYDMGFSDNVVPYPLTGLQLIYALLVNEHFIPGPTGTYIAIGSVTEPLHPALREKTLEYIECMYKYLGNPVQISTKVYVDKPTAEKLANLSRRKLSPLVTVVTLKAHRELEPLHVSPERRLEGVKNLREAGLKPFLFLRPIIPGLTEHEYREIVDLAVEHGAVGVVLGSLRVTKRIISNLKESGVDVKEILKRLSVPVEKMKPGVQYDVYTSDIKREISRYAAKRGLIPYPSACMANLYTHGLTCWRMCSLQEASSCKLERPSRLEVEEIVSRLGGKLVELQLAKDRLLVKVKGGDPKKIEEYLRARYLICTRVVDK
jgi:DNA repair photolyase